VLLDNSAIVMKGESLMVSCLGVSIFLVLVERLMGMNKGFDLFSSICLVAMAVSDIHQAVGLSIVNISQSTPATGAICIERCCSKLISCI
jgi:hypothetical protein